MNDLESRTWYACKDCEHVYGQTIPSPPVITLHRVVSHNAKG